MTALVCDLGGTNARLGLIEDGRVVAETTASHRNENFANFSALLDAYLTGVGKPRLDAVCIALAAPATAEGAQLTNRDWNIRRTDVAAVTGARDVHFLNDFEALGFSLLAIDDLETTRLHAGTPPQGPAPKIVLGAGTGFNAAACFPSRFGSLPHVAAAECGHMTLAIEGPDEIPLQAWLARGRTRASNERALSGKGLIEIYEWVCTKNGRPIRLQSGAEISALAVSGEDADCREAAEILIRLLGRVTGDLALAFLPMGGIYLSGGVTRALSPLIQASDTFMAAFRKKGRQAEFMESFPLFLLHDDHAALSGCATWLALQKT